MQIVTVTELARVLKEVLEGDERLQFILVRGELQNCKLHPSGHFYFTLRDETSQIRGVMFRSRARLLTFAPKDGDAVLITGQVAFYEQGGQVQLYAEAIEQVGIGAELLRLQELRARLQAEGLFSDERKRPLPLVPRRIGVVTSASGAALRDIIQVGRRRHPRIDFVVSPARVQGQGAAQEIVAALARLVRRRRVDVIIIGRGGGGQEDLSAFNDEAVVRAVAGCPVPVVAAVGHETDFTLVDFAADRRAPTPSAAAEICVPSYFEWMARVGELRGRLEGGLRRVAQERRRRLQMLTTRGPLRRPEEIVRGRRDRLAALQRVAQHMGRVAVSERRAVLRELTARLQGLSPLGPLERGYALVLRDGQPIEGISALLVGDRVELRLRKGSADARIEALHEEEFPFGRDVV